MNNTSRTMRILESLGDPLPGQPDYSKAVPVWQHEFSDTNRKALGAQQAEFDEVLDDRCYFNVRLATIAVQAERP